MEKMAQFEISIKAARINAGLTQKELAKIIGVSNLTISSWETGKTEPTVSQLKKIAEVTDINIINLVTEKARTVLS